MNATPTTKITTPIENSGLDTLYMTDSKAYAFAVYMIQPVGADDAIGWCLDKDQANEIVRAVNSFDAMRELINQNDDLLAELSQYVSDEHIRLIAEQRKRNNDTLDRIEEGEINQ